MGESGDIGGQFCNLNSDSHSYDAAVLGGVQETPQFRSAIGVSSMSISRIRLSVLVD